MTIYNVSIFTNIVTQVVGGGGRRVAFKLSPRSLCLGKNSKEREGKVGGGGDTQKNVLPKSSFVWRRHVFVSVSSLSSAQIRRPETKRKICF